MKRNLLCVYLAIIILITWSCSGVPSDRLINVVFSKPEANPVLGPDSTFVFTDPVSGAEVKWQKADVFNPGAIEWNGKIYLLLRCEDNPSAYLGGRTSRIGLAYSTDGINFERHPVPVLYPDSGKFMVYDYPGGCEDPRVVQAGDSLFVMAYTSWNRKTARLSIAFSKNLYDWEKKGPAFARAYNGKYLDMWSKSGSIVTEFVDGKAVAALIDGKYWMYWGEKFINLAWSENLYDWYPLEDESGELLQIVNTRAGKFDSDLVECGPPAIMSSKGIILFYNGKNSGGDDSDPSLPRSTYSVGRIVFDKKEPARVLSRTDEPLLKPGLPHELTGQYSAGTTFAEGLVWFGSRWYLYYGTADSFVGVAVSEQLTYN